jgi:hypothetical protein
MIDVQIIETATGRVVARERMQLSGQNYTPAVQELEAKAWRRAVQDRLVDPNRKDDYSFRLVEVAKPF